MHYRVETENGEGQSKFKYFYHERSALSRAKKINGVVQINYEGTWFPLEKRICYKKDNGLINYKNC